MKYFLLLFCQVPDYFVHYTNYKYYLWVQETKICIWNHPGQHRKGHRNCQIRPACWARARKNKAGSWRQCQWYLRPRSKEIRFRSHFCPKRSWNFFWRRWWLPHILCPQWRNWVHLFTFSIIFLLAIHDWNLTFSFQIMQKICSECDWCKNNVSRSCRCCWVTSQGSIWFPRLLRHRGQFLHVQSYTNPCFLVFLKNWILNNIHFRFINRNNSKNKQIWTEVIMRRCNFRSNKTMYQREASEFREIQSMM